MWSTATAMITLSRGETSEPSYRWEFQPCFSLAFGTALLFPQGKPQSYVQNSNHPAHLLRHSEAHNGSLPFTHCTLKFGLPSLPCIVLCANAPQHQKDCEPRPNFHPWPRQQLLSDQVPCCLGPFRGRGPLNQNPSNITVIGLFQPEERWITANAASTLKLLNDLKGAIANNYCQYLWHY